MIERDERPLSEVQFALGDAQAQQKAEEVRGLLRLCGVTTAQDIVDLGCTGLVLQLEQQSHALVDPMLVEARFVRENMSGSICGLPCYVPNHLFCLVHNTVGGLQASGNKDGPQSNPHPAGLALCSRPLTPEEGGKLQGVQAFAQAEAIKEANAHFGAEVTEPDDNGDFFSTPSAADACPVPLPPFVCREHGEFTAGCRYCLAQSIVEGSAEPDMLFTTHTVASGSLPQAFNAVSFARDLNDGRVVKVELYVLAGRWVRKLVKE
jgi:hypothetical protein